MQRGGGVLLCDRQCLDQQHVAGIEADVHLHDRDAGLRITRFDGAVNRRGSAPARQQAGVNVQATQTRPIEHPLRQDQAVGRHHHAVCAAGQQRFAGCGGVFGILAVEAQAARLADCDALVEGDLLDRRGLQLHATSSRAIGLRQHQRHLETRIQQALQGNGGEFGGSGKNNLHGDLLVFVVVLGASRAFAPSLGPMGTPFLRQSSGSAGQPIRRGGRRLQKARP